MMCAALAQLVEREAVTPQGRRFNPYTQRVGKPTVSRFPAASPYTPLPFLRKVPLGWIIIHR